MPTTTRKPRTTRKPVPQIELPEHVKPTDHELSVFARFVRASREGSSWIAVFVEYLLHADTCTGFNYVPMTEVGGAFSGFAEVMKWKSNAESLAAGVTYLQGRYPDFMPNLDGEGVARPEDEDYEFMELVEMWRREHPEPPKTLTVPQGHLGRGDESGD